MRLFDNLESGKRDCCIKGLNPRGVRLPCKRLMGMCRWMAGSHFPDWIDYNAVVFSIELLEWGRTFSDFWGKTVLHIYG